MHKLASKLHTSALQCNGLCDAYCNYCHTRRYIVSHCVVQCELHHHNVYLLACAGRQAESAVIIIIIIIQYSISISQPNKLYEIAAKTN